MASSKNGETRERREMWVGLPGTAVWQGDSQCTTSHSMAKDGDEQAAGQQSTPWVAGDTGSFGDREVLPGKDLGVPGAKLERDSTKGNSSMKFSPWNLPPSTLKLLLETHQASC